jgi:hypothetical protein
MLETAQTPTTQAPALFAGDRVHAVVGATVIQTICPVTNILGHADLLVCALLFLILSQEVASISPSPQFDLDGWRDGEWA